MTPPWSLKGPRPQVPKGPQGRRAGGERRGEEDATVLLCTHHSLWFPWQQLVPCCWLGQPQ